MPINWNSNIKTSLLLDYVTCQSQERIRVNEIKLLQMDVTSIKGTQIVSKNFGWSEGILDVHEKKNLFNK